MKNTLSDLNNYLFEQIERLQDDSLSDEQFNREVERSKSITNVAKTIIENGALAFQARKHMDEYGVGENVEIPLLGITNKWLEEENKNLKETVSNLQERIRKMEQW